MEVQIPVAKAKLLVTMPAMSEPRAMKPQMMWIMPSAVAALILYASLMSTFSLGAWMM